MITEKEILNNLINAHNRFSFCTKSLADADKRRDAEAVKNILPHFMREFYLVERLTNRLSIKAGDEDVCRITEELLKNVDTTKEYVYVLKERMEKAYGPVQEI